MPSTVLVDIAGRRRSPATINRTASAHFTGGIPIADSMESGAVDPYQRMFGQPGLHVIDGSVMPANTGVNRHSRSPPSPSARCRSGRTRATRTPDRRWAPATSASSR